MCAEAYFWARAETRMGGDQGDPARHWLSGCTRTCSSDEMGYFAYGSDAANLFFHVVNERHLKCRSMVFTTNKTLNS